MKSTGIIRRIDNLGRIVIPKEIRKSLRLIENDSMEIYIQGQEIVLKKYAIFDDILYDIEKILNIFSSYCKCDMFLSDSSRIVCYSGVHKKQYETKNISDYLAQILKTRKISVATEKLELNIACNYEPLITEYILLPIISNGDVYGILGIIQDQDIDSFILW